MMQTRSTTVTSGQHGFGRFSHVEVSADDKHDAVPTRRGFRSLKCQHKNISIILQSRYLHSIKLFGRSPRQDSHSRRAVRTECTSTLLSLSNSVASMMYALKSWSASAKIRGRVLCTRWGTSSWGIKCSQLSKRTTCALVCCGRYRRR